MEVKEVVINSADDKSVVSQQDGITRMLQRFVFYANCPPETIKALEGVTLTTETINKIIELMLSNRKGLEYR